MGQLNGLDVLRELVLPNLQGVKPAGGDSYVARCPAHDDNNPSLSLSVGTKQPVVLNCHANCSPDDILAALGLTWEALSAPREREPDGEWVPGGGRASAIYEYHDEDGKLLYQVLRIPQPDGKKTFRQRVPDLTSKTGWRWRLGDVRRVPYRLPRLVEAVNAGEPVWITEGEKDADALYRHGLVATCNSGGAGKWEPEFAKYLRGADVTIVADRDKPGYEHARKVAASLDGVANSWCTVEAAEGKDVSDHLAAGHKLPAMVTIATSDEPARVELVPDLHEFLAIEDPERDWAIPGLLERGDRLIWTGLEGLGKSVVLRQLAVAAAAGLHPFDGTVFVPRRVLFIDCENSDRQGRRHFRKLAWAARYKGRPVPDQTFFPIHLPAGIDLAREEDAAWLLERVAAHKPDLLFVGPFYRLHRADTGEELAARRVVQALDAARVKGDCALIVEAHAGHGDGYGARKLRPAGSSLLMRWPEYGYGIEPNKEAGSDERQRARAVFVKPWRGARDDVDWPTELCKSAHQPNDWPWSDPNKFAPLRAVPDTEADEA